MHPRTPTPAPPARGSNMAPALARALILVLLLVLVGGSSFAWGGPRLPTADGTERVPAGAREPDGVAQTVAPPVWPAGSGRSAFSGGQSRWWPAAGTADLVATDTQVVLRPGLEGVATDRSGALWLHGPWLVARVDPRTGSATQWGPGDDAAFAEVTGVRPAAEAGVWLLAPERLRLFDGVRYVRDMAVPARYRADSAITDMVDLGSEVWVSSAGGVARCVEGVWSPVASDQLTEVAALAVDDGGVVWAAGRFEGSAGSQRSVVRFAAGRWHHPGGRGVPGVVRDVVAEPGGAGVLIRTRSAVGRVTSAGWRRLTDSGSDPPRDIATAGDGRIWVLDAQTIRRTDRAGRWRSVARGRVESATALAVVDDELWVADAQGLLRLTDGHLQRVWTAGLPAPVASARSRRSAGDAPAIPAGQLLSVPTDRVLVGSRDLIYSTVADYPYPFRLTRRGWQEVVLDTPPWSGPAVMASDGAIWIPTRIGLVRAGAGRPRLVPVTATDGVLHPDREGGVWATPASWYGWWYARGSDGADPPGRMLTLIRPEGPAGQVPLPRGVWQLTGLYPGPAQTLWATNCAGRVTPDPCSSAPALDRWDGRSWSVVPYPGSAVRGIGVDRNAFWALVWAEPAPAGRPVLARYDDSGWTLLPQAGVLDAPRVSAGGLACGGQDNNRTLVCVDHTGRVERHALAVGELITVGSDGSVWVGGDGAVARVAVGLGP